MRPSGSVWRSASAPPASATPRLPAGTGPSINSTGTRIATAYPNLVRKDLAARGIAATVIRLDGAVEISVQLGLADVIADIVGTGRTLGLHGLAAFGEALCDSEAILIESAEPDAATASARDQLAGRVQGVVFGQQYLMLDYDCPRTVLDRGDQGHPGIGVAHHRAVGRSGVGRGARAGASPHRQRHHGRAGGHRRQGHSGL